MHGETMKFIIIILYLQQTSHILAKFMNAALFLLDDSLASEF